MGMSPPVQRPPAPAPRPPFLVRLFTSPVTADAVERRLGRMLKPAVRVALTLAPFVFGVVLILLAAEMWTHRAPMLEPRHRAEALCFALAQPPRFTPPMGVEPSAAMVRGRFPLGTPPAMGLRMAMHFDERQIVEESRRRVGDYEVAIVWLRVPEPGVTRHWLVVGWMEEADLAVCSFRFAGRDFDLSDEQRLWGQRLLERILDPEYFELGTVPRVRMRADGGESLPHFGPRSDS